jgi:hypothetical protein
MNFINGDTELLLVDLGDGMKPVCALIRHSISEGLTEFLETCKTTADGGSTFLPRTYNYNIPFEGMALADSDEIYSYESLKEAVRARRFLTWETAVNDEVEGGSGYLTNIEKISQAGDLIRFTANITGYGMIESLGTYFLKTDDTDLLDIGTGFNLFLQ